MPKPTDIEGPEVEFNGAAGAAAGLAAGAGITVTLGAVAGGQPQSHTGEQEQEVSSCSLFFLIFDKFSSRTSVRRLYNSEGVLSICFSKKFYFSKNSANFFHVLQYVSNVFVRKYRHGLLVSALPCTSLRHTSWNSTSIR